MQEMHEQGGNRAEKVSKDLNSRLLFNSKSMLVWRMILFPIFLAEIYIYIGLLRRRKNKCQSIKGYKRKGKVVLFKPQGEKCCPLSEFMQNSAKLQLHTE